MSYIDGFVIAVPTANKQKYIKHAKDNMSLFKEFGATRVVDGWGDDVPDGKVTDFRGAVKAQDDETVLFSWIEWPDKEVRDAGMKLMMDDARFNAMVKGMPFDGNRMIFGGFQPIVDE